MPVKWRWPDSLHLVPWGRASWQGFPRMLDSGTESHQCRTWSCCQYFRGLQQGILGESDSLPQTARPESGGSWNSELLSFGNKTRPDQPLS